MLPVKWFALCAVPCLLVLHTLAQTGRWSLALSTGVALPVGQYAKTGYQNMEAGYARPGEDFRVQGNVMLNRYIGITVLSAFQINTVNKAAVTATELYTEPSWALPAYRSIYDPYYQWRILVGPTFALPLIKGGQWREWNLTARLLAGDGIVINKETTVITTQLPISTTYTATDRYVWTEAPLVQAGIGFQYYISKRYFVQGTADFVYARIRGWDGVLSSIDYIPTSRQPANSVNLCLGGGIQL